ncbi:hypothetical protein BC941DRAFT_394266 [Chlamydoabsidia padenii]|nr:hypothetical protein BC941DRAFT_394266 [Chlamydoabsidia padenii]
MTGKTPKPTGSISSKYTKASYSLTNHPDALLLYRDMAKKTGDKTVQYNYAKYLMEIAALYDQGRETKRGTMASIKQSLENAVTLISPTNSSKHHQYESKSHRRKKRLLEEEGIRWMKQLARDHMPDAAFTLATWMDESKYGFTRNLDKSFALYEIAAKAGIWEATYKMGLYYGKMGDHRHALTYLSKASDLGVVPATLELAKVYLHGKLSQKQDLVLALNHLHKASLDATESCPEPPYMFGQILSNTYPNMDIPRQVVEPYGGVLSSLPYFERAVQLGYAPAHSTLGYILEHGLYGVRVNYAQCYIHYNEAAKKGDAMAMVGLSRLNNQGAHGPTDNDKASFEQRLALDESGWLEQREPHEESAFYWCHKAADQGLADAEALLGWYYEIGLGTIRDLEKAKWYCQKAKVNADQGNRQRLNHKNTMDITTLKTTITTPTLPPYQHHPSLSTFGTPRKESQQCVSM